MMTARITLNQTKQLERFTQDAVGRALKELNPDKDGMQRLIERGGEFQTYIVSGLSRFTSKLPDDYTLARSILGADFISPEEVAKSRKGVVYTDEQLTQFGNTVPSQEVLKWCRDNGYMVVAGPNRPMSLFEIHRLQKDYFYLKGDNEDVVKAFAWNEKVETGWIMLCKESVPQSTSKNWFEQQVMMFEEEVTPNAAVVAWCMTTYKAVRNIYLLPNLHVRTSSHSSDGRRVSVGDFDVEGLVFHYWLDDSCNGDLGVSAGRKQ